MDCSQFFGACSFRRLPIHVYPFILLNLTFSLQAAYAAPLILLAQTRQAARDKAHSEADAKHREAIAVASSKHSAQSLELLRQNTDGNHQGDGGANGIETLMSETHRHLVQDTTRKN
ncbi:MULTISPECIES: DUF1003 domain-containing protein [unclassified Duganella]|uniref:DUF1003 domain-containing protein n=1 Tax=unclassified Duganella TaxID=2636909 RepID=UPI001E5CF326|nr:MULTISPECIES: DUF1003 domain-containing protein [unclassified Duganella]